VAQVAKAVDQLHKTNAIPILHGRQLKSYATTRLQTSHKTLCSDLSFLHEKLNLRYGTDGKGSGGFNEQATQADIANWRGFSPSVTAPVNPYSLGRLYARVKSP
jgi:hypothetical protein